MQTHPLLCPDPENYVRGVLKMGIVVINVLHRGRCRPTSRSNWTPWAQLIIEWGLYQNFYGNLYTLVIFQGVSWGWSDLSPLSGSSHDSKTFTLNVLLECITTETSCQPFVSIWPCFHNTSSGKKFLGYLL